MTKDNLDLAEETCEPCVSDTPPMAISEAMKLLHSLNEGWSINASGRLERVILTKDFAQSHELALFLGKVALRAFHYPDLVISYGLVHIEIWTRAINGLRRADFVLAAKLDRALKHKE